MAQHTLRSGCIAVAATFALALGVLPLTAGMASADTPTETVIPAALQNTPPKDLIVFAGTGGFLHQSDTQSTFVWTRYAGGPDIPVPGVRNNGIPGVWGAGSDVVATPSADGFQLHDMDSGTTATITPGAGQSYVGTFGSRVLTVTKAADGSVTAFHVLGVTGGRQTDTPVTGWPAGATPQATVVAGDADSVVIRYTDSTGGTSDNRLALVDLASGDVTPVMGPVASGARVVLSGKYIAWYPPYTTGSAAQVHLVPRSAPGVAENIVQVPPAPLGSAYTSNLRQVGFASDSLLITYAVTHTGPWNGDDTLGYPLYAMPLSGSTTVTPVLDHANFNTLQQEPGGAVALGGSSITDWAARLVTAAPDGTPTATAVDSDPGVPVPLDGLAFGGGKLYTVPRWSTGQDYVNDRTVQLGSPPTYGAEQSFGQPFAPTHCDTAATCHPPVATGDGNVSQLWPDANSQGDAVTVQNPNGGAILVTPGATGGTLVDSAGPYVVYNGGSTKKQYIGDAYAGGNSHILFSRPLSAAALSGSTVWVPGSTAGSLTQIDLTTQRTVQTVATGAPCVPSELQAAAEHWVYWSCGTSGPAGVWDLATGKDVPVPAGLAQLGDGFVVEHDTAADRLTLTDLHTDTATTTDLANLPSGPFADDRRVTWAVDKYAGGIAYLDSQRNIHLVDPHVPASAPAPAAGAFMYPGQQLSPGHSLSSSTMTLTMQTDGNLVAYLKTGKGTGQVVWSTRTNGNPGAYAEMQADGNLVVYKSGGGASTGGALWSSRTYGFPGAYATVQDDGNVIVCSQAGNYPRWASGTYARPQSISPGTTLKPGWWTQGTYTRLVMQTDGNLVMYRRRDGAAIWSSRTYGKPGAYAVMQTDGNFVVYKSTGGTGKGGALWSSRTDHNSGAYAVMQNDGNLVVYKSSGGTGKGGALWSSGTTTTAR
ncbi:hypothetical protein [Actinacidiphila oryziradicis]|uniref:Bulb-type lectin domain-containing protein n=1 Tax=Actinacidiphila oryziradicis TaxID=2571141 RepID=A0A4U0SHR9_9ACTN|nr:hypothetical protein [Actinacidiphila oryziradicis]TJZ99794.1 hypothetical protein FCI23_44385 [Actinacidiphila oryziradicis]